MPMWNVDEDGNIYSTGCESETVSHSVGEPIGKRIAGDFGGTIMVLTHM